MSVALESSPTYETDTRTGIWAGDIHEWVSEYVKKTPLVDEQRFLGRGNRLYTKRETAQATGSFKERGSYVAVRHLVESGVRIDRIVVSSAGNHAQGAARAGKLFAIPTEIHLPADVPPAKTDGISLHGGDAVSMRFHKNFDTAKAAAKSEALLDPNAHEVPPFDDEWVMAGQGTVGLELLEQALEMGFVPDRVFVPVGGGGLLGGIAEAIKRVSPETQVIGVQMKGNDSVWASFHKGRIVQSSSVDADCDGTAVVEAGELCMDKIWEYVDDVILVEKSDIGAAYADKLMEIEQLVPLYGVEKAYEELPEPAGILAEAGARVYAQEHDECQSETWITIASGGNYDPARVASFVEAYDMSRRRDFAASHLGHRATLNGPTQRAYIV